MTEAATSALLSCLQQHSDGGNISKERLAFVLRKLDPGIWDDSKIASLTNAVALSDGTIPIENLVSNFHLQTKVAALEAQKQAIQKELDALQTLSKQGGVGFAEGVASNADKPGLQGLLIKVNHVSRICLDAERSREFYEDVCGATRLNRPNFPSPGYWLWLGNVQLHLIQGKHAKEEASHAKGIPTGNVNHISFEVWDFDAVEAKLKKIKYPYKKNRVPEGGNVIHQLFLQDPDGHYIEICDCNKFTDFVFAKPDPAAAKELAKNYLEGVDPTGASVAAVAALAFVPGEMKAGSQDELNESVSMLQRAFKIFSKGDDFIEAADLGKTFTRMGHNISEAEILQMIAEADKDGSGHIHFAEFVKFMAPRLKPQNSNEELKEAFDAIDVDKSGKINSDELLLMLWGVGQRLNEEQLVNAIKKADKDGCGEVDFNEFLTLFEGMSKVALN